MFYIRLFFLIGKAVGKCTSHMDPMGIQVYQHEYFQNGCWKKATSTIEYENIHDSLRLVEAKRNLQTIYSIY